MPQDQSLASWGLNSPSIRHSIGQFRHSCVKALLVTDRTGCTVKSKPEMSLNAAVSTLPDLVHLVAVDSRQGAQGHPGPDMSMGTLMDAPTSSTCLTENLQPRARDRPSFILQPCVLNWGLCTSHSESEPPYATACHTLSWKLQLGTPCMCAFPSSAHSPRDAVRSIYAGVCTSAYMDDSITAVVALTAVPGHVTVCLTLAGGDL